jgi:acetylornithine deacetylase
VARTGLGFYVGVAELAATEIGAERECEESRMVEILPAFNSAAAKDARKLLRPLRRDLLRLLRELIRINTVAVPPNGNETPGQLALRDFLLGKNVRPELYEIAFVTKSRSRWRRKDRRYAGRKNLVARLGGSGRGKSLLLNGHMDTVPAGRSRWSASPWAGNVGKGRIYGLGSFDMKGGLVAQAGVVCALRAAGLRLSGDLIFESVADEEWGGGGGTLAARLRGDSADACVISEGTQLEIFRATRGGFVVDLIVEAGDPRAYFSQGEVLSPAIPVGRLLGWVDSLSKKRRKMKGLRSCPGAGNRIQSTRSGNPFERAIRGNTSSLLSVSAPGGRSSGHQRHSSLFEDIRRGGSVFPPLSG